MIPVGARIVAITIAGILIGALALAQGPDAGFDRANEAYAAGRYGEAADGYEELARLGVEDPRLEYNLGNALFKSGRVGAAILHRTYGDQAQQVAQLAASGYDSRLVPYHPVLEAEVLYAARYEMAERVIDVLARPSTGRCSV